MANCNCIDFPISCAPHAPGGDCCHPHGCPPHPCPPPPFKGGTSMYIGARYVPIFADPVEWDDEREYEPLTIVVHDGNCYTSKCYVPKGAQLPPYPEGQTKYWVKTSDYNYQFADLKKTVLDLSRLVEQFQKDNERFTELINGWNEKVIQWEKDMTAWGERLDTVESNVADLTASLNAEIDRAKAAEQANAAAIAQETADRKQAVSELDAAYKAADAAEAQARAEADTALSNRITTNTTDIDAIKAEQVIQNTNISANAKNISDNAAEIAKHAARLTDLESNASDWDDVFPDTTIAQEVQKEENARANAVTELKAKDSQLAADIEEVRDLANHKVDQTVFQAADNLNVKYSSNEKKLVNAPALFESVLVTREDVNKTKLWGSDMDNTGPGMFGQVSIAALALKSEVDTAQAAADKANANIGDWETDHPGQTIAECITSQETELEEHAGDIARLEADKANKTDLNQYVTNTTYTAGQKTQDDRITALENNTPGDFRMTWEAWAKQMHDYAKGSPDSANYNFSFLSGMGSNYIDRGFYANTYAPIKDGTYTIDSDSAYPFLLSYRKANGVETTVSTKDTPLTITVSNARIGFFIAETAVGQLVTPWILAPDTSGSPG